VYRSAGAAAHREPHPRLNKAGVFILGSEARMKAEVFILAERTKNVIDMNAITLSSIP
jgi:hypothetical protein